MTGQALALAMLLGVQTTAEVPILMLPPGEHTWVVRITTTGGVSGRGNGGFVASSAGEIICVQDVTCPERLAAAVQRSLSELVISIPITAVPPQSPFHVTSCMDCVVTTMTVSRRDGDGERMLRYTWDVSTAGSLPEEARRLHAAILALARL